MQIARSKESCQLTDSWAKTNRHWIPRVCEYKSKMNQWKKNEQQKSRFILDFDKDLEEEEEEKKRACSSGALPSGRLNLFPGILFVLLAHQESRSSTQVFSWPQSARKQTVTTCREDEIRHNRWEQTKKKKVEIPCSGGEASPFFLPSRKVEWIVRKDDGLV